MGWVGGDTVEVFFGDTLELGCESFHAFDEVALDVLELGGEGGGEVDWGDQEAEDEAGGLHVGGLVSRVEVGKWMFE